MRLILPGIPKAMPRQRVNINKKTGVPHHYMPKQNVSWTELAREQMRIMMNVNRNGQMFEGPVCMFIIHAWKKPQYLLKKTNKERLLDIWCPKRNGDLDNLMKNICDAGNGILYKDDAQVCLSGQGKIYLKEGEEPRTEILIEEIKSDPRHLRSLWGDLFEYYTVSSLETEGVEV